MTNENNHETGTHLRIYDSDGLIAAFTVDGDAVAIAAEIFNTFVGVKK